MSTQYIVFGYVMYSNDYYANKAEDTFMDFDPVETNYRKRDFDHHYFQVFGKAPELEPTAFAFSHIF